MHTKASKRSEVILPHSYKVLSCGTEGGAHTGSSYRVSHQTSFVRHILNERKDEHQSRYREIPNKVSGIILHCFIVDRSNQKILQTAHTDRAEQIIKYNNIYKMTGPTATTTTAISTSVPPPPPPPPESAAGLSPPPPPPKPLRSAPIFVRKRSGYVEPSPKSSILKNGKTFRIGGGNTVISSGYYNGASTVNGVNIIDLSNTTRTSTTTATTTTAKDESNAHSEMVTGSPRTTATKTPTRPSWRLSLLGDSDRSLGDFFTSMISTPPRPQLLRHRSMGVITDLEDSHHSQSSFDESARAWGYDSKDLLVELKKFDTNRATKVFLREERQALRRQSSFEKSHFDEDLKSLFKQVHQELDEIIQELNDSENQDLVVSPKKKQRDDLIEKTILVDGDSKEIEEVKVMEVDDIDVVTDTDKKMTSPTTDEDAGRDASSTSLRFGTVTIREYPMVVGDNPSVTKGVPVTIAWEHLSEVSIDCIKYETVRIKNSEKGRKRNMQEMRMTAMYRFNVLKELGFSVQERNAATKDATIIRKQRHKTYNNIKNMARHERIEKVISKISNIFSFGMKKRKERRFLKRHVPSLHGSNHGSNDNFNTKILKRQ